MVDSRRRASAVAAAAEVVVAMAVAVETVAVAVVMAAVETVAVAAAAMAVEAVVVTVVAVVIINHWHIQPKNTGLALCQTFFYGLSIKKETYPYQCYNQNGMQKSIHRLVEQVAAYQFVLPTP